MTVNTTDITSGPYIGNGITDTFEYDFRVTNDTQLTVFETDTDGDVTTLMLNSDYTVTGVGNDGGGDVVLSAPLTDQHTLFIRSNYQPTQETDFSSQGAFFPEIHESAMDKLTFLVQQLEDGIESSFKLPDSYSGDASPTLPLPEALRFVRWNATATALENTFSTGNTFDQELNTFNEVLFAGVDTSAGNEWTASQNFRQADLTSTGNSVAWDAEFAQVAQHELTEDTTIAAPTNLNAGMYISINVVQDSTPRTLDWDAVFNGSMPDIPVGAGEQVNYRFYTPDGANLYYQGVDPDLLNVVERSGDTMTGDLDFSAAAGPAILNENASNVNPVFVPRKSSPGSGIGANGPDNVDVITDGSAAFRFTTSLNLTFHNIVSSFASGPAFLDEVAAIDNPTLIPERVNMGNGVGGDGTSVSFVVDNSSVFESDSDNATLHVGSQSTSVANITTVIDWDVDNHFRSMGSNLTFTDSNLPAVGTVKFIVLELDYTSGTPTWPAAWTWPNGTEPVLDVGVNLIVATIRNGTNVRANKVNDGAYS